MFLCLLYSCSKEEVLISNTYSQHKSITSNEIVLIPMENEIFSNDDLGTSTVEDILATLTNETEKEVDNENSWILDYIQFNPEAYTIKPNTMKHKIDPDFIYETQIYLEGLGRRSIIIIIDDSVVHRPPDFE